MKVKNITESEFRNMVDDYESFVKSSKEADRYTESDFTFLKIGDGIYKLAVQNYGE